MLGRRSTVDSHHDKAVGHFCLVRRRLQAAEIFHWLLQVVSSFYRTQQGTQQ